MGLDIHREGFLALGDSYTIGEGVAEAERWPMLLARRLRDRGIAIRDPRIIARTGWTTDELDAAITEENASRAIPSDHALVSLLIGVNNQYRGRSLAEYESQFATLLERAIAFAGGEAERVLVMAIPDWGITPFAVDNPRDRVATAVTIDAFNAAASRIANGRGAAFVDIAPLYRAHGAEPTMLVTDGLHPSGAMYALWAGIAEATALTRVEASRNRG